MDSAAQLTDTHAPSAQDSNATDKPDAIDLSHHLSKLAKARRQSPLKTFSRYMGQPGLISLAGGLPDPSYFPLESLSGALLPVDQFSTSSNKHDHSQQQQASSSSTSSASATGAVAAGGWFPGWLFGGKGKGGGKQKTTQITVPKFEKKADRETLQLSGALQYGSAEGLPFLQSFLKEWTSLLSPPQYSNWSVLLDDGSTDGWHKVIETLCNPGDPILVEAWTYPSAIESGWPMGVRAVPVGIDADGLLPQELEKTLEGWDVQQRGCKRPTLLYTVPVGQNPCGSVAQIQRKKEIYNVCVKYDVIICEDDPYYILQFPWEEAEAEATTTSSSKPAFDENRQFLRSLSPSYLTIDTQGRVVRLDTFSKTVAPGCRLGWITSNAVFSERILRASETSTQQPSGFAQVMVGKILESWGMEGWIRWLRGLRAEYRARRDVTVDAFHEHFKMETRRTPISLTASASSGAHQPQSRITFVGYEKYSSVKRTPLRTLGDYTGLDEKFANFGLEAQGRRTLISFSPPEGGMFVWLNVHIFNHPQFRSIPAEDRAARKKATKDLMNQLWEKLAEAKVLVAPGWFFAGDGLRSGAPDEEPKGPQPSLEQQQRRETEMTLVQAQDALLEPLGGNASVGINKDLLAGIGHFRIAFSYASHETLREGVKRFSEVVVDFFDETAWTARQ